MELRSQATRLRESYCDLLREIEEGFPEDGFYWSLVGWEARWHCVHLIHSDQLVQEAQGPNARSQLGRSVKDVPWVRWCHKLGSTGLRGSAGSEGRERGPAVHVLGGPREGDKGQVQSQTLPGRVLPSRLGLSWQDQKQKMLSSWELLLTFTVSVNCHSR